MNKPLILVLGATGKTGTPVVEQLLDRRYPVRAFVRTLDARSERLEQIGADIAVGNFLDLPSIKAAMKGVDRAYFCYPPMDRLLQATTNVAIAARAVGLKGVVNMSQISAREGASSPLAYEHWQAEQVLDWADIGASHVNPTFFAEDLYLFTGASVASEGRLVLPFGEGRHAPIAAEDIARVVVGILENPMGHVGQRYTITGPTEYSMDEVAHVLGHELDKPVEYVDVPVESWEQALVGQVGFTEYLAHHLAEVARDHQSGVFAGVTDVVECIGGQLPQTLADFIRTNRSAFETAAAP